MEIKRLFILIITNGRDIMANEVEQVLFDHSANTSPTGSGTIPTTSSSANTNGMKRNRSFDKFVNMFKTMRPH
jgi:bisphosphoglycerate-independent phosphoglycerate mutase (AlkP superfamily)